MILFCTNPRNFRDNLYIMVKDSIKKDVVFHECDGAWKSRAFFEKSLWLNVVKLTSD